MSEFTLGQRVEISGTAVKQTVFHTHYAEGGLPKRDDYDNPKLFSEGVIVGRRTVQDGRSGHSEWDGNYFTPIKGTAQRVWLVAFSLDQKPAMCFPYQITPIEESP